jgi:hypothetical protein
MRAALAVVAALAVAGAPAVAAPAPPAGKKHEPVAAAKKRAKQKRERAAKRRAAARRHAAAKRREAARRKALAEQQASVAPATDATAPALPATPVAPVIDAVLAPVAAAPLARTLSVAVAEFTMTPSRTLLGSGLVTIELRNVGEDPHDLRIDTEAGVAVETWDELAPGDPGRPSRDTKQVELAPGTYRLLCTITGHAALGMATQVTVAAG